MTTLNIQKQSVPQVLNLVVTSGVKSTSLSWTSIPDTTYEVWSNTADDLASATKIDTVLASNYTVSGLATKSYFWVRAVNGFGTPGPFSTATTDYTIGSNFNTLYLNLWVDSAGGETTSIQNVKARVYYTTAGGVATNTGLIDFTSTVTQTSSGYVAFTNPGNARVDDTAYATVVLSAGKSSENLLFKLSDIGVPSTATVTGVEVSVKGKTTDYTGDTINVYLGDNTGVNGVAKTIQTTSFTANNTNQTVTAGGSTELFGLLRTGAVYTPSLIASADTAASTVTSSSTSIAVTISATTVSAYGTWYNAGYCEFTPAANDISSISKYVITTVSSVSSTGTNILNVWARSRLYDVTASADVPGGTKQVLLFSTFGATTYGNLTNITNFTETFVSGFRGLLTPGHTYRLYMEVMKEQKSGSPTCELAVNGSQVSSSSTATVS